MLRRNYSRWLQMPVRWLILGVITAGLSPCLAAQRPRSSKRVRASAVPRTADGHPDLQGVWANSTITPLERPKDLGDREFLAKEEAEAFAEILSLSRSTVTAIGRLRGPGCTVA